MSLSSAWRQRERGCATVIGRVRGLACAPARSPRSSRAWRQRDRGSATIVGVGVGLVVLTTGLVVASVAVDVAAWAEARGAADLAALAGAGWARAGQDVACARARDFAAANRAVMVSCVLDGLDVEISVEVKGIRAVARAGPTRAMGGSDAA